MDLDSADFPFIPTRTQHHQHRFQSRSPSRPADPRTDPRSHRRSHSRSHNYSHSYSHQPLPSTQPSTSASTRPSTSYRHMGIPPASPEVIANLITSLSVLSSPTLTHGDPNVKFASLSLPATPYSTRHSPGLNLEYGAYSASPYNNFPPDESSDYFGEANNPSFGLKSKRMSGSPTQDHRSFNRDRDSAKLPSSVPPSSTTLSRPSSRASNASKHDDSQSQSIGNLTIERGAPPAPDLRPRKSIDSWCKKTNRNSKNLLNLSPREVHRDVERNLSSPGVTPGLTPGGSGSSSGGYFSGRTDSSLADDSLSGGPTTPNDGLVADVSCHIPARDSSLQRTGIGKRLSGVRRSKRNSDGIIGDAIRESICEVPECLRAGDMRTIHRRVNSDLVQTASHNVDGGSPTAEKASSLYQVDMFEEGKGDVEEDEGKVPAEDEGAPFPSVGQGRRRDEPGSDRSGGRLAERLSVGPQDSTRPRQSGSRLKRLSAGLGSPIDKRSSNGNGGGGGGCDEPRAMPSGYERPKSADSVDDAVETYLCSPRLSRKIKHPQTGRIISFSEVGDPEGSAVFCCVGMGLTRYITAFYDELALTLKLRLITPDRPGVGASEPCVYGTATPLSWPDDVYAICQALKITKFSILAHSAGAIYALATALRMPQHIRGRIHLLAPWIPPSQMSVFGTSQAQPPSTSLPTSQRILRALPTPILKAANSTFMSTNSFSSSLPKNPRRSKRKLAANSKDSTSSLSRNGTPNPDKDSFGNAKNKSNGGASTESCSSDTFDKMPSLDYPNSNVSTILDGPSDFEAERERQKTYDLRLTHAIWELATMHANPALDLLVCLERQHTIGFRYVDITRPVVIHHGSKDNRVPVENVKWLGRAMRRCEVRVLEHEGHGLMASATVMGSVLMEISREWDDWIRATGADERK